MTLSSSKSAGLDYWVQIPENAAAIFGLEWGDPERDVSHMQVRDEWLIPSLSLEMTVLEIGSGGGRWSRYFKDRVARAILVDGTFASQVAILRHCEWCGFQFNIAPQGFLWFLQPESIDYAFSMDTFVHFETPVFEQYVMELGRVLRHGAKLHLHYARYWPENVSPDPGDYAYRDESLVARLLDNAQLRLTDRRQEFHSGHGSLLVEAVRS